MKKFPPYCTRVYPMGVYAQEREELFCGPKHVTVPHRIPVRNARVVMCSWLVRTLKNFPPYNRVYPMGVYAQVDGGSAFLRSH